MKRRNTGFFWASFTDLMISLFFIMLVLYVMTYVQMKTQQQITENQLNKMKEIQSAVKELPQNYFTYQSEFKRFSLNKQIQFEKGKSDIAAEDREYMLDVGRSIQTLISKLKTKYQNENIKYLIVIEGMASVDGYTFNNELSYQRALGLAKFWKENQIVFDPNFCELQIAGSGTGGVGRYSGAEEYKNQRFLIQIIPKIGDIDA